MRASSLLASLLFVAAPAAAQQASPISVATLKDVTKTLSSDAYEGRKPNTAAEPKTVDYLIQRFKAAGLTPGNDGSWTQDVPLVEMTATDVTPLVFKGGKTPLSLTYRQDMVVKTYRVAPKVAVTDSPVVFVGYGITAPERGWDDYAGIDVRGKTVVILINDSDWQTVSRDGVFEGRAMTYYGRWTYKYEEAARHGAAAAIIVHDTEPAAYGWGVVQSSNTGPQLELDERGDHADQSAAIGWMQLPKAKALFASAGQDFDTLSAAAKRKGFKAVPFGVTASVGFSNTIKRQASKNVIGILPGTTKPDEYVFYTAHWDHLGHCDPVNGDGICNGALDNASGTAGLVALAEAHAKAGAAKRSLVFLSVTCEECGLLGSRYYAEHPVFPMAQTVGGVNMDGISVVGRAADFQITGAGKSALEDMMTALVKAQGRTVVPEPNPEHGGYFRSDQFSFARAGVPMFYGESGEDLRVGGKAAGAAATADYLARRYHKPQDEYDPSWDWSGGVEDVTLYYRLGRQLAEGAMWPEWYKTAEFKAIRDKSRPGK